MKTISFSVKKEPGGYKAQCLEFPSIITESATKRDLVEMIRDAANGYFEAFPDEKEILPNTLQSKVMLVTVRV